MKARILLTHFSGGIDFSFQILWEDRRIGIYAVSLTLARWCWTLEIDTKAKEASADAE
jgi:hypothetical protein